MANNQYSEVYCKAVEVFAAIYGTPLPRDALLSYGSATVGWGMTLNPCRETRRHIEPFGLFVTWGGLPAGVINAAGGTFAAGCAANEDTFVEWLDAALARIQREGLRA